MKDIEEIKKRSIIGVVSYTTRTIILHLIALVATGLLSYFLTEAEFGIYFIVISVVGIFTFLSDIGLAATLIQKEDEPTLDELRTTFTVQQTLAVLIFLIILALTPFWREYSGLDQNGLELLYVLGFSFMLASLKTIPSILMERKLEFNKLIIPQVFEQLIFYSVAVYLAWQGFGVKSYTLAVLLRSIVGVVVIYLLQTWPIGLSFSMKAFKGLFDFGIKFQINDFLARLKDDLFIVVLSRFIAAKEMGYIAWGKRWSMFPYQFSVNSVISITFPTFSRLQAHPEKLKRAIEKSLFFITLIIFPILMGMSMMAEPLVTLIDGYHKWRPALLTLYFFCINVTGSAISSPLTNTLNALGYINQTLKLMVMWTALTWLLTPLGVMLFGYTGVAIASAVIGLTSFVTIGIVKRYIPFNFNDQVWRQALASLVMGGALFIIHPHLSQSWLHFFGGILLGVVLYLGAMAITGFNKLNHEIRSLIIKKL